MMFATEKEINRCKELVSKEIKSRKLSNLIDELDKIVKTIMNLTYSKGGDYSNSTLQSFIDTYFECEMYKKLG